MNSGGCSRQGPSRDRNEDSYHLDPQGRFCIVADGIGGNMAGEVASRLACQFFSGYLDAMCESAFDLSDAIIQLRRAFHDINDLLIAHRGNDPRLARMGTTAVVALVSNTHLLVAGLGDSRGYLVRDGKATQLTVDHTIANGLIEAGILPPEKARFHPYRNVLHKFIGCDEIGDGADVECLELQPRDRVLLATDGVTDRLDQDTLASIVETYFDPQDAADRLIQSAINGGASDDATCVVAAIEGNRGGDSAICDDTSWKLN